MFLSKLIFLALLLISSFVDGKRVARGVPQPGGLVEIPLTQIGYNYYGQIRVGTPLREEDDEQVFTVNFDTGSQHLWIVSHKRCAATNCIGVDYMPYDGTKSKSYTPRTESFEQEYADGTVIKGKLAQDHIRLGNDNGVIEIRDQTFGEADDIVGIFQNSDGIFGLGLISDNVFTGDPDPPIQSMLKKLNVEVFGLYINRHTSREAAVKLFLGGKSREAAGKLFFGGYDEKLVEGEFTGHNVVKIDGKYEGWKIHFDRMTVEKSGKPTDHFPGNMLALVDSGCQAIVGPKKFIADLNEAIFKHARFDYSQTYSFFCDEMDDSLPNVSLFMDGIEYVMTPEDYIWVYLSGITCRTGFIGKEDYDHIVLGQSFLKTFYTQFDVKHKRVEFARAK